MKKLLSELKEYRYITIVFCIFLGLFILAWILYGMIMPSKGKPLYGNRLDGIEKVEITDSDVNQIVSDLENNEMVNSASVHISGKIINILVEVKEGTKVAKAKALNTTAVKSLDDEKMAFYDIQIFITNENSDAKGYPVIGYKNASEKKFVF